MTKIIAATLVLAVCRGFGPRQTTWTRNSLYFKDASVEMPGKLKNSSKQKPDKSHPTYADDHAFHGNFGRIDVYIMDAKLRKEGVPSSQTTADILLKGFARLHGLKLGKPKAYKSPIGRNGLQLVAAASKGTEQFGVVVHSASKGARQVNIRIAWPRSDKSALDMAFRISNSLRFN